MKRSTILRLFREADLVLVVDHENNKNEPTPMTVEVVANVKLGVAVVLRTQKEPPSDLVIFAECLSTARVEGTKLIVDALFGDVCVPAWAGYLKFADAVECEFYTLRKPSRRLAQISRGGK